MSTRGTRSGNDASGAPVDALVAILLVVPFVIAGLVDVPRAIRWGTFTALGLLSIGQLACACGALLLAQSYPRAMVARFVPYGLFLGWMIGRSAVEPLDRAGFQNAVAYLLFGAHFLLAGTMAGRRPGSMMTILKWGFAALDAVALPLVLASFLYFGLGWTWLVGPRSVALLGLVPLSWHLAGWCHGRPGAGVRALAWITVVVTSLSRTAAAVALIIAALVLLAHAFVRPGRLVRQVPALAIAILFLASVVVAYEGDFAERYFGGYDQFAVAGVAFSPSGRNHIWPVIVESAMRHPILGGGLGSSQAALGEFDSETVGHPHNEYLRIWHDGGLIGVTFLVFAFVRWLTVLGKQWLRAARRPSLHPDVQLAGFLTLLGMMLAAITDNGLVYPFVMAPSGLLIGAALGFHAYGAHTRAAQTDDEHRRAPCHL